MTSWYTWFLDVLNETNKGFIFTEGSLGCAKRQEKKEPLKTNLR